MRKLQPRYLNISTTLIFHPISETPDTVIWGVTIRLDWCEPVFACHTVSLAAICTAHTQSAEL